MADNAVLRYQGVTPGAPLVVGFEADPQAAQQAAVAEQHIIDAMHQLTSQVLQQLAPWQKQWRQADGALAKLELLNKAHSRGLKRGVSTWTNDQVGFVEGVWNWAGDQAEAAWDWYSDLPLLEKFLPGLALADEAADAISAEAQALWEQREQILALVQALANGSINAVQRCIEMLAAAPGEIGELMQALWDKGDDWVHALIEVCRESRALDVIFTTLGSLICAVPPNLWVEGGSTVGGYVLPEVLLNIVLAIIAALSAGAGAVALSARMALVADRLLGTCKKMGKLGNLMQTLFNGIKRLHGDIVTLVKWLYKKIEETANGSINRVKHILRRSEREPDAPTLTESLKRKRWLPTNLVEAERRLASRREEITAKGYQGKYSDAELRHAVKQGTVGDERFQVRFMETKYLTHREKQGEHLSGAMGQTLSTEHGRGAKYWATSFDQLEDKDTDPKLICESLGLKYNPKADYSLVIVDTQKAMPLTGTKSVPATFEKLGDFGNTELPDEFPKSLTDKVMTPEFQAEYAKHYQAAEKAGAFEDGWSPAQFEKHLTASGMDDSKVGDLVDRMKMHEKLGNNEFYTGDGLTKNLIESSSNKHGVVETFNFERKEVNLAQLSDANAITIIPGLRPVP